MTSSYLTKRRTHMEYLGREDRVDQDIEHDHMNNPGGRMMDLIQVQMGFGKIEVHAVRRMVAVKIIGDIRADSERRLGFEANVLPNYVKW
jgi:hypothetical protein